MSVCTFIASDSFLIPVKPLQDYPSIINLNTGEILDGGADDNYFLNTFKDVDLYTDKKYGVWLEWNYTVGRAKQIIEYIKSALNNTDSIELWHIWLMDCYDYEERPIIYRNTISIEELTTTTIYEIDNADIWNKADKMYPDRPSFYCLRITRCD